MEQLTSAELTCLMPYINTGAVLYITQGGGVKIPQNNVVHIDSELPTAHYIIPFEQIQFKDIDTIILCHYLALTNNPIRTITTAISMLKEGGTIIIIENNNNSSPLTRRNYFPNEMEGLLWLYNDNLHITAKQEAEKDKSYMFVLKKIAKGDANA